VRAKSIGGSLTWLVSRTAPATCVNSLFDYGPKPGFGAPCPLLKCMRESKEWGPL
jgi:hypothetical protein